MIFPEWFGFILDYGPPVVLVACFLFYFVLLISSFVWGRKK